MYRTIKMMMTTPFGKNMGFLSFLRSKFCPVKGGIQGTQMLKEVQFVITVKFTNYFPLILNSNTPFDALCTYLVDI